MKAGKYINTDPALKKSLSRIAYALLLPLILLSNKNNEINKKRFMKAVGWINDYRTWNKYWKELVDKDVLIRLDKRLWMLSPHECYADGVSQDVLIHKWDNVKNTH